jgi:hypothetical protein
MRFVAGLRRVCLGYLAVCEGDLVATATTSKTSGINVEPIAAAHIDSFHRALDVVAREKKYLSMLEATPLPQTRKFVMGMIAKAIHNSSP